MTYQRGDPLPDAALDEKFLAATGPGGQNVNKVATAVQLRLDVYALRLPIDVFRRLREAAGSRWTQDGAIIVVARTARTREANRGEARERLQQLVDQAWERPARRVKTRVSKAARQQRMDAKSRRGSVKRDRAKFTGD